MYQVKYEALKVRGGWQKIFWCILSVAGFIYPLSAQADVKNSGGGFIDFNAYPYLSDTDNDTIVTINVAAKLENRFSYFSLLNLGKKSGTEADTVTYYTEQNLRWKITETSPFDLTIQLNFRSGEKNDRHRLGVRWRLNDTPGLVDFFKALHLKYALNLHGIQFDHEAAYVWQMEHAFRMVFPGISDRLYLAGFIDHTFNQDLPEDLPRNPIVAEVQFGVRLVENFFGITEYRINQYRRGETDNLAVGVEYKIVW
ncbi:hypothetical protein [Paremcibacter congregatus]|uniref:hypothetical protein n=1 Tax=Paremcibacter congregatus TaxID=2043170 RepID=UPI00195BAB2C|nr:hypothetical protein [Paremcibacter congregatus]